MTDQPFSGAVLAGGSSSRMGVDKALIDFGGTAMTLRVAAAFEAAGATETFVVGRPSETWPNVVSIPDLFPREGPLGGIISALRHASCPVVVTMPCDLLQPSAAAVRLLVEQILAVDNIDVVLPVLAGRPQFVQSAFRRSALDHLAARFAAGDRSVRHGIADLKVVELAVDERAWFADADEPNDLPPEVLRQLTDYS